MFETWTERNRITTNGLVTQYLRRYDKTTQRQPFWEYRRIRTKNYEYVGLTEAAAKACTSEMLQVYTRLQHKWTWNATSGRYEHEDLTAGDIYQTLVATVQPTHGDGGMWSVSIQVNEDVTIYLEHQPEDVEAAFEATLAEGLAGSHPSWIGTNPGKWEYEE